MDAVGQPYKRRHALAVAPSLRHTAITVQTR
jgi:hypothetical protein